MKKVTGNYHLLSSSSFSTLWSLTAMLATGFLLALGVLVVVPQFFSSSTLVDSIRCTDSTVLPDYFHQRAVAVKHSTTNNSELFVSSCVSDTLLKWYVCDENHRIFSKTYQCETGCSEGACIVPADYKPLVFLNANTTSCSIYSLVTPVNAYAKSELGSYRALAAIDTQESTYWFSDYNTSLPTWLVSDLRAEQCVRGLQLSFFKDDLPVSLLVQASLDEHLWTTVIPVQTVTTTNVHLALPAETTARYLRVVLVNTSRAYASIGELQIDAATYVPEGNETYTVGSSLL